MNADLSGVPWSQPGWINQAGDWIRAELAQHGIALCGPITQPHVRAWSTVLRIPTSAGNYYFKATTQVLANEAPLTAALSRWRPDCMPQVLAVNRERGWLLMPDYGVPLRSIISVDRDLNHWRQVLPLYAGVQIEAAAHLEELLVLGALDRRLSAMPAQFRRLLADTDAMRIGQTDGLTLAEYNKLIDYAPRFEELCRQLASYHIPETVDHGDFHDANIFVAAGRYIFTDWGDSCVSQPFTTLVVTMRSLAHTFGHEAGSPELEDLRDAYLEPWTRYEPRERLQAAFALAQQVGRVSRALTWHRVVSSGEGVAREENAEAVPRWLKDALSAIPALSN